MRQLSCHAHSEISYTTPMSRHLNEDKQILEKRKEVYKRAKELRPERWMSEIRDWNKIEKVSIKSWESCEKILRSGLNLGDIFSVILQKKACKKFMWQKNATVCGKSARVKMYFKLLSFHGKQNNYKWNNFCKWRKNNFSPVAPKAIYRKM